MKIYEFDILERGHVTYKCFIKKGMNVDEKLIDVENSIQDKYENGEYKLCQKQDALDYEYVGYTEIPSKQEGMRCFELDYTETCVSCWKVLAKNCSNAWTILGKAMEDGKAGVMKERFDYEINIVDPEGRDEEQGDRNYQFLKEE